MTRPTITKVEFFGGPEDGRILDFSDCPAMVAPGEVKLTGRIPLLLALDNVDTLADGDEVELLILGYYMSFPTAGNCARFEWFPLT